MDQIEILAAVGNKVGNDYWECNAPSYYRKPDISTSLDEVFELVKIKYVKAMYAPKDRMNPVKEFLEAKKDGQTTAGSFNKAKMGQRYLNLYASLETDPYAVIASKIPCL